MKLIRIKVMKNIVKNELKNKWSEMASKYIMLYGASILKTKKMQEARKNIQHKDTSVFDHSVYVAYYALYFAFKYNIEVDIKSLVRGALLHDYFQYDWHKKDDGSHRLHGLHHARRALINAKKDYSLNLVEENIIDTHMFPLNLRVPKYKESILTTIADKYTAWNEGVGIINQRMKDSLEKVLAIKEDSIVDEVPIIDKETIFKPAL